MEKYTYATTGTCSRGITFSIDTQGRLHDVQFHGGCPGNTTGVAALVEGMDAAEAVSRLRGITCGSKPTSCPDQLAQAILQTTRQK